ncbi:MAG TPA: signal peptidase I [bacterium]|nr:signal peptidase I [bacterium]
MKLIVWLFSALYELFVDLILAIIGHHRNKTSFERKEKIYIPFRAFLNKTLGLNIKNKAFEDQLSKRKRSLTYKVVEIIILILAILWLRYSVIEPYKIPSGSMIPTLKIGDHIFVNKLAYGLRIPFLGEVARWDEPKRGDVVIFKPPLENGKIYVKRLVGLPGDKLRVEDNKLYINDNLISKTPAEFYPMMEDVADNEQYTPDIYKLNIEDLEGIKHYELEVKDRGLLYRTFSLEVVVPKDYLFFMGDNRDNSEDSRVWGFASRKEVRGKAMFVWLSLDWSKMFTPSWIRFSRFGKKIK